MMRVCLTHIRNYFLNKFAHVQQKPTQEKRNYLLCEFYRV